MSSVDTIVIGKRTYETVLEYETWPYFGKRIHYASRVFRYT